MQTQIAMKIHVGRFAAVALVLCLPVVLPCASAAERSGKQPGLRVYHIGNSHTHSVRNVLMPLAVAAGHPQHYYSWSSILGAPLRWIWDHDKDSGGWEGVPYSQGLAADQSWDALTLQPYARDEREVECAVKFAGLAYRGNPKCQVYLYTIWPGGADDWDNPPPDRSEKISERCAAAIAKAFPQSPAPRVVPTSLILRELGRLADAGELPHVPNRFALLSDGGHLSNFGSYAVNVTFCSMLYDESPLGYPARIPGFGQVSKTTKTIDLQKVQYEIPRETADVIRRVVWDVLAGYAPAHVDAGLVIVDRRLAPAIAGRPYEAALKARGAEGAAAWSLAEGQLPEGLQLSAAGVLSGTAASPGRFAVAVKVADGKRSFQRPFTLVVSEDKPPAVPEQPLPKIPLDKYFFRQLQAAGGVGHLTWSVAEGKLPHGVMLTAPGVLIGTPGESGEFSFLARVSDSHPAGPRNAQRWLSWTVGRASSEAIVVRPVTDPVTIDGKLDEPCWSRDVKLQKSVRGSPGKAAYFALAWQKGKDWRGGTLYVAVKVLDADTRRTPKDAVEIFLDGLHNGQVVYNADDTHFVITRDGKKRSVRGKPDWFLQVAAAEVPGGYVLEMAIPSTYFIGEGAWVDFGRGAVYGFDVAVDEGDQELHQQVWHGTQRNAEDTSGLGSIVLVDQ